MQRDSADEDDLQQRLRVRYEELRNNLPEGTNDISGAIIGAAIDVHRYLGPGFSEAVYEDALCLELAERGIPFARQVVFPVSYKATTLAHLQLDLVVRNAVVVELKAVTTLVPIHQAQLLSYLRVSGLRLGLLINFNVPRLRDGLVRVIDTNRRARSF